MPKDLEARAIRPAYRGTGAYSGASSPSGAIPPSTATDTACSCGAGPHAEHDGRCANGHALPGNTLALVTGERSVAFWREHDRLYRELREEIARDAGHDAYQDAPAAARAAFDGLAQAVILRDSAYLRTVESGGPMTSKGRTRRAADFQQQMDRRAEAWARLVGLKRTPKPAPSLGEYLQQRQQAEPPERPRRDADADGQAETPAESPAGQGTPNPPTGRAK